MCAAPGRRVSNPYRANCVETFLDEDELYKIPEEFQTLTGLTALRQGKAAEEAIASLYEVSNPYRANCVETELVFLLGKYLGHVSNPYRANCVETLNRVIASW